MDTPISTFLKKTLYDAVLNGSFHDMIETIDRGAEEIGVSVYMLYESMIGPKENTPLPIVAFESNKDTYKKLDYLINKGANLSDAANPTDGKTLLDYAHDNDILMKFLEKRGFTFGTSRGHGRFREKFEFGGFTVINAGLDSDVMARTLSDLKKPISRIKKFGFGEILYGPLVIISSEMEGEVYNKKIQQYKDIK